MAGGWGSMLDLLVQVSTVRADVRMLGGDVL